MIQKNNPKLNSVEKAIFILKAFDIKHPIWGVRELSSHLGFSPTTVQRLLQILKKQHFVKQESITRQYQLGSIYFNFVHTLQNTNPIAKAAMPLMNQLLAKTKETVHLNVIDKMERLCIANIEPSQSLKASMPIGSRSPLFAGASSKCLLSFSTPEFIELYFETTPITSVTKHTISDLEKLKKELEAIRKRGYANSLSERNPGIGALSAAILGNSNQILASLSLAIPEIRFKEKKHREKCVNALLVTARELSLVMGNLE